MKSGKLCRWVLIAIILHYGYEVRGEEITYQPGPEGSSCVRLSSYGPADSHSDAAMVVAHDQSNGYITLLKFNLPDSLPKNADQVELCLYCWNLSDKFPTGAIDGYRLTSYWDNWWTWYNSVYGNFIDTLDPPQKNNWYVIDITIPYNNWQSGVYENDGLGFVAGDNDPYHTYLNVFYTNKYAYSYFWPKLVITYTPTPVIPATPDFKLPLPGGKSWMLFTEIGGKNCGADGLNDDGHTRNNFYSLDLDPFSQENGSEWNVPIFASAGGVVTTVGTDPKKTQREFCFH